MAVSTPPAYDASLADHGFEAKELKGLTYPLGEHAPQYGGIYPIAPDMGWTRMPVPGCWMRQMADMPLPILVFLCQRPLSSGKRCLQAR
jgi:hypothetical protein